MIDNIIMVKEVIHSSCAKKYTGMIIKIYMENDFDRVRHSFLLDILHKFGFSFDFI
jgi:hypothetical protein